MRAVTGVIGVIVVIASISYVWKQTFGAAVVVSRYVPQNTTAFESEVATGTFDMALDQGSTTINAQTQVAASMNASSTVPASLR